MINNDVWSGYGEDTAGNRLTWTATYDQPLSQKQTARREKKPVAAIGKVDLSVSAIWLGRRAVSETGNNSDKKCNGMDQ